MNEFIHLFMAVLFVGWSAFIVIALFRFHRSRNPKADYLGVKSHASSHLEVGVVIVEAVLLLGFAFPFWKQRVKDWPTGPDVVHVRAVGYQFGWFFHYPGPDGQFGRVDPDFYATHPVALDLQDPGSKDDIVVPGTLTIPVDRPCVIDVTSKDVIHNLAIVPMRIAQDAFPGQEVPMWFTPTKKSVDGPWEIICGQLCGAGHSQMKAFIEVISEEDWAKWLEERTPKPAAPDAEVTVAKTAALPSPE